MPLKQTYKLLLHHFSSNGAKMEDRGNISPPPPSSHLEDSYSIEGTNNFNLWQKLHSIVVKNCFVFFSITPHNNFAFYPSQGKKKKGFIRKALFNLNK